MTGGPEDRMSRYMEIITRWGCGAACLVIAALSLPTPDASAQTAEVQTHCFDIISPRNTAQPDGSILLDRCTGQTWLLSRNGRRGGVPGYRWTLLVADGGEIGKALLRPEPRTPAPLRPSTGKCFSFQGRQFCE
jgi:hypothetical protein